MSKELSERIAREVVTEWIEHELDDSLGNDEAVFSISQRNDLIQRITEHFALHLAPQPAQPREAWEAAIDIAMEVRSDAADWKTQVVAKLEAARDSAPPQPAESKAHDVNCPLWMMTCKCARLAVPPPEPVAAPNYCPTCNVFCVLPNHWTIAVEGWFTRQSPQSRRTR